MEAPDSETISPAATFEWGRTAVRTGVSSAAAGCERAAGCGMGVP